jgi:hypothetical protein
VFQHIVKPRFLGAEPDGKAVEEATGFFRQFAAVLNDHLRGRTYVLGDTLTIADFSMAATLPQADQATIPVGEFPEIVRWHERLNELPAWRQPFPNAAATGTQTPRIARTSQPHQERDTGAMKRFLAVYLGSSESAAHKRWNAMNEAERKKRERTGMGAWMRWGEEHQSSIADTGTPLGKTKRVDAKGMSDTKNTICGYVIVEAETHEAAARMFADHPHFSIFPGQSVEIMECLPLPKM